MKPIRIEQLSETNFKDYERLTSCESGGGCYCSFWHQKWTSMSDWETAKKNSPEMNRSIVYEKMRSGFHIGVLAYDQNNKLLAWISVGPLTDFYWTWKRAIHVGESAKTVAGITCITLAPDSRGQGLQSKLLKQLQVYAKASGWTSIEGYPFDPSAVERQKEHAIWPGLTKGFIDAGFLLAGPHWLNHPGWERSIYKCDIV